MTLVSDIIRDAYRESNINAIGVSPTAAQQDEGIRLLNRLVASAIGDDAGERLVPLNLGNNGITRPYGYATDTQGLLNTFLLPDNTRIFANLTSAQTVYLNPKPEDGARLGIMDKSGNLSTYPLTIIANGQTITGLSQIVLNTNKINVEYFYREDLGDWTVVNPLGVNDTFPFPSDADDFFIVALAMRLNPRNGAPIDPQSMERMKDAEREFKARYRQITPVGSDPALTRLPSNRRNTFGGTYANGEFNSGYPFLGFWR